MQQPVVKPSRVCVKPFLAWFYSMSLLHTDMWATMPPSKCCPSACYLLDRFSAHSHIGEPSSLRSRCVLEIIDDAPFFPLFFFQTRARSCLCLLRWLPTDFSHPMAASPSWSWQLEFASRQSPPQPRLRPCSHQLDQTGQSFRRLTMGGACAEAVRPNTVTRSTPGAILMNYVSNSVYTPHLYSLPMPLLQHNLVPAGSSTVHKKTHVQNNNSPAGQGNTTPTITPVLSLLTS